VTQQILGLVVPLPRNLTAVELARYPEGAPLPALAEGSVVRSSNGPLYAIRGGKRVWIKDAGEFAAGGYAWDQVISTDDRIVRTIPLALEPGMLLKGGGDRVYVYEGEQLRWISSQAAFETRGYAWSNVHFVSSAFLLPLAEGQPIA
jgi:hypothetical protein